MQLEKYTAACLVNDVSRLPGFIYLSVIGPFWEIWWSSSIS